MHLARRQPDEAGFTLIELLIGTVILGLLGSAVGAAIILFFKTADGTSRRFDYSHDSQLLATYLIPDLESLAGVGKDGNVPLWPIVVSPGPGRCPTGSESFSDLQVKFTNTDPNSNTSYVADYNVSGSTIVRSLTVNGTSPLSGLAVVHNLKAPDLACFSTRSTAPWTMTVTTGPLGQDTSDDYSFSVTAGGRVTYPPPSAPLLRPADDSGTKGDNITKVSRPTFTGTARPGDIVKLFDGSSEVGTAGPIGAKGYSVKVNAPLADGDHTITATATDTTGDTSVRSGATTVTIDTVEVAPSKPVLAPASESGPAGDNITNINTPSFTGTAEDNSTPAIVALFEGSTKVGAGTSNGGLYTATITSPLADGKHTITAKTTDAANNTSSASPGLLVTVDTAAPTILTANATGPGSGQATGALGTANDDIAIPVFAIYAGSPPNGPSVLTGPVTKTNGTWSVTWTGLAPGMYTIVVTQTDAAGNTGAAQQAFTQS